MTPEGLFEPIVMFFGLTNLPVIFQTMMNEILRDLINTGEVVSFINNVIVETEKEKGHDEVEEVVKRLVENNLYMKLEKMKSILEWLAPKGVKDIQKFLGLANYYWQFIKDFTVIARPLHNLVKKYQKWNWTERQEKAFKKLKEKFTKELILAALDLDLKNEDGSRYIRLHNRESIIYGI